MKTPRNLTNTILAILLIIPIIIWVLLDNFDE